MRKIERWWQVGLGLIGLLALVIPVLAQGEGLTLTVRKQAGYNLGSQIQGRFKLKAQGPAGLITVTFQIDGEELGTVTAPPFELSFQTAHYAPGWHELSAVGRTAAGQTIGSPTLRYQFLSSEEVNRQLVTLIAPVAALILGAMLVSALVPLLTGRRATVYRPELYDPTRPRNYGWLGGAICPRCGRPFARHWWAFNAGLGKLDRCPHCHGWSLVRRASREALLAAEAAEYAAHTSPAPRLEAEEADKLKQQLDDSRFMGL